jgi:UDP-hydrolysing UDP-N-acetyl-D-glucosamine 2-epimerase
MKKRKIVYITGTRAEYGVMLQILHQIHTHPNLELSLIVTGMHLSKEHGYTLKGLQKDKFNIGAVVDAKIKKMDTTEMAKSLGYCVIGMAESFQKIKPDIVLLEGDRGESLAAAIAAAHMNIPIVHISGGDISGSIDNSIRKAITCFAHIHLANTQKSAQRLIKMGEQPWRVHMVGALGLDRRFEKIISPKDLSTRFGFDLNKPLLLMVQHPVTGEATDAGSQMKKTLDAIVKLKQQTILIYPNSDAGGKEMIAVLRKYQHYDFIKVFESLPRRMFLSLMAVADVLIGNSSAGLVETPLFNLPTINIGTRQQGRERGTNVIDVGYDTNKIYTVAKKIISHKKHNKSRKTKTPYKNRNTAKKVVDILITIPIDKKVLQKYGH